MLQGTGCLFHFACGFHALLDAIQRNDECSVRDRKGQIVIAQKATWSQDGAHLKAECAVSDKNGLDTVVFAQIKTVVFVLFEGRVNWKEREDGFRSSWGLETKDTMQGSNTAMWVCQRRNGLETADSLFKRNTLHSALPHRLTSSPTIRGIRG